MTSERVGGAAGVTASFSLSFNDFICSHSWRKRGIDTFNNAIHITLRGVNAAPFHLRGGHAQMNGGDFFLALPLIAAMVNVFSNFVFLQILIDNISPARAPFLRFALLVPIHHIDFTGFELAAFEPDSLAVFIQQILFSGLRALLAALFKWAQGE